MKKIDKVLERWLGSRPPKQPMPALGPREIDVLKILWHQGELSAQKILRQTTGEHISLSTMQSTLERLHRKGLVDRHKSGRSYLYRAVVSQSAIISRLLQDLAFDISDGDMAPMISGFMSFVSEEKPNMDVSGLTDLLLHAVKDHDD